MKSGRVEGMVSTIIPVYNRPDQLVEAAKSVLAQDYRPIEIIIINDGSTDADTPKAAEQLRERHPELISVEHQVNAGPGIARERGRLKARGEFVQYLDSDDVLLPGKFRAQVDALRTDPEAHVAYGITLLRDSNGKLESKPNKQTGVPHHRMFPLFLNERWWNTSTPLYRSSVLDAVGAWTDLRLEEDWEYDCRVAALGGHLAYVPQPVSEHRTHRGPRLSVGERLDPCRLVMRATSHALVWKHAKNAGVAVNARAEVSIFSRSMFLLARECGAAGLAAEAEQLLEFAREAQVMSGRCRLDLSLYQTASRWLGHRLLGRCSIVLDQIRNRRPRA